MSLLSCGVRATWLLLLTRGGARDAAGPTGDLEFKAPYKKSITGFGLVVPFWALGWTCRFFAAMNQLEMCNLLTTGVHPVGNTP